MLIYVYAEHLLEKLVIMFFLPIINEQVIIVQCIPPLRDKYPGMWMIDPIMFSTTWTSFVLYTAKLQE